MRLAIKMHLDGINTSVAALERSLSIALAPGEAAEVVHAIERLRDRLGWLSSNVNRSGAGELVVHVPVYAEPARQRQVDPAVVRVASDVPVATKQRR